MNLPIAKPLFIYGLFLGTIVVGIYMLFGTGAVWAHDWFPPNCCSGADCRVITPDHVKLSKQGFVIPGNPEVVPYSSPKIKRTPPEGEGNFAICTKGGAVDGAVICLYIPDWNT